MRSEHETERWPVSLTLSGSRRFLFVLSEESPNQDSYWGWWRWQVVMETDQLDKGFAMWLSFKQISSLCRSSYLFVWCGHKWVWLYVCACTWKRRVLFSWFITGLKINQFQVHSTAFLRTNVFLIVVICDLVQIFPPAGYCRHQLY